MSIINYLVSFLFLTILVHSSYATNLDYFSTRKDTLNEDLTKKSIDFDLPDFDSKLVCLQFKYLTTDSNDGALLRLYLVKKQTKELSERLWSSKLLFNKQKIYEELNIDTEILNGNVREYQLEFRLVNNQDVSGKKFSIEDVLDVKSVNIKDNYCQSRYKCIKNDCLWSTFKNETQEKNLIKLKSKNAINHQSLITPALIEKLDLNLKDYNVFFVIHNKNKHLLNETIYSPALKLPINLNEIEITFDCKALNTQCLHGENVFVEYKFAEEYFSSNNTPKQLIHHDKHPDESVDRFIFKLGSKNLIAKQAESIVFWITIKLRLNQTLVLSNIEVKNYLANDLDWKKCDFERGSFLSKRSLPCGLEQHSGIETDKLLYWRVVNEYKDGLKLSYIKLENDKHTEHTPNELYLPRVSLQGDNHDCLFKFKFNTRSDANLFVYFVDDHKRIVKIWEKNEDAFMITMNDFKHNWTDVSIYLGNIYQGFRLSFGVEQLAENSSVAIGGLAFENCSFDQSTKVSKQKRPNELDIIRISYEEPKPMFTNEQTLYKCDFEHLTIEECGLYQDELLDETCAEEFCTPSEFLKSLDNFDGMTDFQLPFRDRSKNFGQNGHYIYLQNMNSNGKVTKAILRFKRTISNRLLSTNKTEVNSSGACKMRFYLRTNGYSLVNYDVFVDQITSGKLISIKTTPKFSKHNFYELNEVSFENINEPFQVLLQGSIKHNYLNQDTFIYMAIDDLSFSKDCLFL